MGALTLELERFTLLTAKKKPYPGQDGDSITCQFCEQTFEVDDTNPYDDDCLAQFVDHTCSGNNEGMAMGIELDEECPFDRCRRKPLILTGVIQKLDEKSAGIQMVAKCPECDFSMVAGRRRRRLPSLGIERRSSSAPVHRKLPSLEKILDDINA